MEFVRESIANYKMNDMDGWFDTYVDKNSKLYSNYIKSKNNRSYAEMNIIPYFHLWLNVLITSNSIISIETLSRLGTNKKLRVWGGDLPIAIIKIIKGKYMYIDIPVPCISELDKEYMDQFY